MTTRRLVLARLGEKGFDDPPVATFSTADNALASAWTLDPWLFGQSPQ